MFSPTDAAFFTFFEKLGGMSQVIFLQIPPLLLSPFSGVSTKWLNLLRKICAIFAQILFLQTFALFLRMKRNDFCAVLRYLFCAICAKPEIFFAKVAHETKF